MSLAGRKEDERRVTVVRDTACSQSLILSNVLPFNSESACHLSTVVRVEVGMRLLSAPTHYVHVVFLSSLSGVFPVALRPCLPVSGVILGNDIAGGKVYPAPQVVDAPLIDSADDLVQRHPNISPVSVVTRSQKCKQTRDVDLSDSFFASILSDDNLLPAGRPVNSSP